MLFPTDYRRCHHWSQCGGYICGGSAVCLPELKMHFSVDSDGGNEPEIEDTICDTRNTQQEQCSASEKEDVEVYAQCGLGDQRAEWRQERVLSRVSWRNHERRGEVV